MIHPENHEKQNAGLVSHKTFREPPDSEPKGSKDPRDFGDNGNPAQSAGRVSAQEQDAHPESLKEDPLETHPDLKPSSLSKEERTK